MKSIRRQWTLFSRLRDVIGGPSCVGLDHVIDLAHFPRLICHTHWRSSHSSGMTRKSHLQLDWHDCTKISSKFYSRKSISPAALQQNSLVSCRDEDEVREFYFLTVGRKICLMHNNKFKRIPMLMIQSNYHYSVLFLQKFIVGEISSLEKENKLHVEKALGYPVVE